MLKSCKRLLYSNDKFFILNHSIRIYIFFKDLSAENGKRLCGGGPCTVQEQKNKNFSKPTEKLILKEINHNNKLGDYNEPPITEYSKTMNPIQNLIHGSKIRSNESAAGIQILLRSY